MIFARLGTVDWINGRIYLGNPSLQFAPRKEDKLLINLLADSAVYDCPLYNFDSWTTRDTELIIDYVRCTTDATFAWDSLALVDGVKYG
jgi:hypothetical protein